MIVAMPVQRALPNRANANRKVQEVKSIPMAVRIFDYLLWPMMFCLGGFKLDSVQETHYWHCQKIDKEEIDSGLSVLIEGDDTSNVLTNRLLPFPTFHAPFFGGWRNYAVLQVESDVDYWHIGWIHRASPVGSRPRAHIQRLRLAGREIKVLKHPKGYATEFFALDRCGRQLPVRLIEQGVLGDLRFPKVRLF